MPKKKSLNVYHLSATENTLRKMPKFNPYQTGHGVIGDTKYNRRKTKRELRKLIDESQYPRAHIGVFFLSHKLAVVNLFEQTRMVGIRHSVATATAFLKTTLPVKEGRFRFISHKFTASNLRYQARRMNNRSYVTEQTTALHLIYQKFN